jgi:hypothetical protein
MYNTIGIGSDSADVLQFNSISGKKEFAMKSSVKAFDLLGVAVKDSGIHIVSESPQSEIQLPPAQQPSEQSPANQGKSKFDISRIGDLGESQVEKSEVVERFRAAVEARITEIGNRVAEIGKILAKPENLEYQTDAVIGDERKIVELIINTDGYAQQKFGVAFLDAMNASYPRTKIGFNHLADNGWAINFFRTFKPGEERLSVDLPLTREDGEIQFYKLTASNYLDATRILRAIASNLDTAEQERKQRYRISNERLANKTVSLLTAVKSRQGMAIAFRPEMTDKKGYSPAFRVRISIADGPFGADTITAIIGMDDAELAGTSIPFDSIKTGQFDESIRRERSEEEIKKMVALRQGVIESISFAEAKKKLDTDLASLKRIATISIEDFDSGAIGKAFVMLERWNEHQWTQQDDGSWKRGEFLRSHRMVPFVVERSAAGIRVFGHLEEHRGLFPQTIDFLPEKSKEAAKVDLPYGGLEILGVMLRAVHYNLERDRRKKTGHGAS